jgi:hypothetical protein
MTSFLETLRSRPRAEPRPPDEVSIIACDPDLDTVGWCWLHGIAATDGFTPDEVVLGLVRAEKYRPRFKAIRSDDAVDQSIERTQLMAKAIAAWSPPGYDWGVIEAQQVYAFGKADANDLLRLAQVTGQLQCRLESLYPARFTVPRPKTWKQNKDKDAMAGKALHRLKAIDPALRQQALNGLRDESQADSAHALDALCMALWWGDELATRRALADAVA